MVNAMFRNFFCAGLSWVGSSPSRCAVLLVAVLRELDDLAVLDRLWLFVALHLVQAIVIVVSIRVDLATPKDLALRHGSEELAKTT